MGDYLSKASEIGSGGKKVSKIGKVTDTLAVVATFKANYQQKKAEGETDRQAILTATGDTLIDKTEGFVESIADSEAISRGKYVSGGSKSVFSPVAKKFKNNWGNFVKKYVY